MRRCSMSDWVGTCDAVVAAILALERCDHLEGRSLTDNGPWHPVFTEIRANGRYLETRLSQFTLRRPSAIGH
jgi:hypothetical protein